VIRRAIPADCSLLARIAGAAYAPYLERIGRRPPPMDADFPTLVAADEVELAELDGTVVGYVVWRIETDHVFIENVAVDPERAGQGIGRSLLDWVERQAQAAGHRELRLYTNARMTENLRLYPRLGWVRTGRRIEDGLDRVFFHKTVER
jgi:ribosomal protein S18 acetylase RimI-like enzyme